MIFSNLHSKSLISFKNKYIYVPIPKAANSTIKYELSNLESKNFNNLTSRLIEVNNNTLSISEFLVHLDDIGPLTRNDKIDYDIDAEIDNYFLFSFIRNPITRFESAFNERLQAPLSRLNKFARENDLNTSNIDDFIEKLKKINARKYEHHLIPQTEILKPHILNINFLGKVENLKDDLLYLLNKLFKNTVPSDIEFGNYSPTHDLIKKQKLSDKSIKIIKEIYYEDFKNFDYKI